MNTISLNLADSNFLKKFPEVFRRYDDKLIPSRKYIDIFLTGNPSYDSCKIAFGKIRTGEIVISNDSVNGIHFHFSEQTKYWEFVRVINNLQLEGATRYTPINDDVWFYNDLENKRIVGKIKLIDL